MDLIKCPVCGEKYSSSYRRCPFCEEEDRPRKVSGKRRGGHHVAERKHTHSARGPLIAVLLVVLAVFSWYLFGGKFMEKIQEDRANDVENVDPAPVDPTPVEPAPVDPTPVEPAPVDPTPVDPTPVDPTPDEPTPPVVEDPEPATPTVDPSALTVGTNVGTTLKKDDSGRFDCTIRMSDSIQLILRGTDTAATWSSEDTSVVTVSADGKLKPVKAGTANVTASVGGTTVRCVVRINN